MKTPLKLFRCQITRSDSHRICDHSNKHLIPAGQPYVNNGTRRGQMAPICLLCGREMILAAHEQLNALMQSFLQQAAGEIPEGVRGEEPQGRRRLKRPRRMFKCEVRRAAEADLCDLRNDHPIQPGKLYFYIVTYTGREVELCHHCAQETVRAAHEQLDKTMQAIDQG